MVNRPGGHGRNIAKLPSLSGYTFRTETIYTALHSKNTTQPLDFKKLTEGSDNAWHWSVYAAKGIDASLKSFVDNARVQGWRHMSRFLNAKSTNSPPRIPGAASWRQSVLRLREIVEFMAGNGITPLDAKIYLIPAGITFHHATVRHDKYAIPLTFYFAFPDAKDESPQMQHQNFKRRFKSLLDLMTNLGHEYFHALVAVGDIGSFPNERTEEATAYMLGYCLGTALAGDPGVFRIPTRAELDTAIVIKSSNTSVGAYIANKNIIHLLGPGKIEGTNYRAKNRLFSLCRAMIRHPVDLTKKELYPLSRLRPVHFFSIAPSP
ncbi:MAG TPA: hypothetical protein VFK45_00475 [Gammaproteobacteria bacterium]|nr:hypothetical protein [Gammaproteobacteria bacterium]